MYPDANDLRTGNILLCHNPFKPTKLKTYTSALIRLGTGSEWNHGAIFARVHGVPMVIEAVGKKGVVMVPYERWKAQKPRRVRVVKVTTTVNSILPWLGVGYDTPTVASAWPVYVVFRSWTGRIVVSERKVYCFELIARIYGMKDAYKALAEDLLTLEKIK